jgi:hypothetical protein
VNLPFFVKEENKIIIINISSCDTGMAAVVLRRNAEIVGNWDGIF